MNKATPKQLTTPTAEERLKAKVGLYPPLPDCSNCGHSSSWHRLDDALDLDPTDPATPFRCLGYDCEKDGPVPPGGRACDCPRYEGPEAAF